jgi:hypothetical protein
VLKAYCIAGSLFFVIECSVIVFLELSNRNQFRRSNSMCTAGAFSLANASADSALYVVKRCERAGIRVDVPTSFM